MTSVAIVEDLEEIRDGLALLINGSEGFECSAVYRTMEAAIDGIRKNQPDVLLVDIGLPGMSGIEGIRVLKREFTKVLSIVLTVYSDDERIFSALCAGACGYLLKKTPAAQLVRSIREAVDGGSPISPDVARRVVEIFRQFRPPSHPEHALTPHELRLLRLLINGHNYKTAAAELDVSVNTISFHIRHIYDKLQVHSKSEAVAKALRMGLVR
ncbi:MAG: response regulator transcription factor [Bryobacterales bacterium]|nr:response regulator transcription factor [Bryobacterales bacterium]